MTEDSTNSANSANSADFSHPTATYRLQLRSGFGFDSAAALAPYLSALGVSHVYLSPILQARPGSTHGYDVIDHGRLSDDLGGPEAYLRMCAAFRENNLGQVVDIVPNHMCIAAEGNTWWWDVLENGPSSLYAHSFDVDWSSPQDIGRNKVLVPILGDHYGTVLASGELRATRTGSQFVFRYHHHRLPIAPRSLGAPLSRVAARFHCDDLAFAADVLASLPHPTATDSTSVHRRHRDKAAIFRFLHRLFDTHPDLATAVDAELDAINNNPTALGAFLDRQSYRVAFWRAASHDLDYRRFFDINELAGLRADDPRVFRDTHALLFSLISAGHIHGLRVDHPDGLADPGEYFTRLRSHAPDTWIVAEKILSSTESLPDTWPIDGTTGYDFLNRLSGLFVNPASEAQLTALCEELTTEAPLPFADLAVDKKRYVLKELLASETERVTLAFATVCNEHPRYRDYTLPELRMAVRETIAQLPVYRTYRQHNQPFSPADADNLKTAVARATDALPTLDKALLNFLFEVLSGQHHSPSAWTFTSRFQQLTGPAAAKGVEDTAFFNDLRLIALDEVGNDPARFGCDLESFHRASARTHHRWPRTMTATSTHDTKRSEDSRLRLAALSEIPDEWAATARALCERARTFGCFTIDASTVYLLTQILIAAWPITPQRVQDAMLKSSREAKRRTSWRRPDDDYESALRTLIDRAMSDNIFVSLISRFVFRINHSVRAHSLSQTLVKILSPGVPDTYQGTELWAHDLTDPDNRREVDFTLRTKLISSLDALTPEAVTASDPGESLGLAKLWVTCLGLRLRREMPEVFGPSGDYTPAVIEGRERDRIIGFTRGERVTVLAPRWLLSLGDNGWGDTRVILPVGKWTDRFTSERWQGTVAFSQLFRRFTPALLVRDD